MEKEGDCEVNDLEKSLHKLLFVDFLKDLFKVGVLTANKIRNSLFLLIVIFFNDNEREEKKYNNNNISNNLKSRKIHKNILVEFRLNCTLN